MYLLYNYINNFASDFCIYLKCFSKKLKCRKLKYLNAILRFLKRPERLYCNNRNEKSACSPYNRFGYTYAEITAYGDNRNYSHYLPYHLDNACSYRNNALSESLQCTSQRQKRIQSIVERNIYPQIIDRRIYNFTVIRRRYHKHKLFSEQIHNKHRKR